MGCSKRLAEACSAQTQGFNVARAGARRSPLAVLLLLLLLPPTAATAAAECAKARHYYCSWAPSASLPAAWHHTAPINKV
jgi:hypothetical protein